LELAEAAQVVIGVDLAARIPAQFLRIVEPEGAACFRAEVPLDHLACPGVERLAGGFGFGFEIGCGRHDDLRDSLLRGNGMAQAPNTSATGLESLLDLCSQNGCVRWGPRGVIYSGMRNSLLILLAAGTACGESTRSADA